MFHDFDDFRNKDGTQRKYVNSSIEADAECTGFMDYRIKFRNNDTIIEPPTMWSPCSVNDFRMSYEQKEWGTCFEVIEQRDTNVDVDKNIDEIEGKLYTSA